MMFEQISKYHYNLSTTILTYEIKWLGDSFKKTENTMSMLQIQLFGKDYCEYYSAFFLWFGWVTSKLLHVSAVWIIHYYSKVHIPYECYDVL